MKKIIWAALLFIAYALFAAYSAYMTSSSLQLNLFEDQPLWGIFVFVFIVALLAGMCLTGAIKKLKDRHPSTGKTVQFILYVLGFILFWTASFMTNVHFQLVEKDGLKVVTEELGMYKNYVDGYITKSQSDHQKECDGEVSDANAKIAGYLSSFNKEVENTCRGQEGFGPVSVSYLQDLEKYLESTKNRYNDKNDYSDNVFDERTDKGDYGKKGNSEVKRLKEKYGARIEECRQRRENAIRLYFKSLLPQIENVKDVQGFINDSLSEKDIKIVKAINTPVVLFKFNTQLNEINAHLPELCKKDVDKLYYGTVIVKNDNLADKDVAESEREDRRYEIYPSERMFNTWTVWEDLFAGRLPDYMKLAQWIVLAIIVDLVAFILWSLFCKTIGVLK